MRKLNALARGLLTVVLVSRARVDHAEDVVSERRGVRRRVVFKLWRRGAALVWGCAQRLRVFLVDRFGRALDYAEVAVATDEQRLAFEALAELPVELALSLHFII